MCAEKLERVQPGRLGDRRSEEPEVADRTGTFGPLLSELISRISF